MDYNIDEFVIYHNKKHHNYCEAIIRSDGTITYAEPSHLYKLQMMWGVPAEELFEGGPKRDQLNNQMPLAAHPVSWLAEVLNCVVVWYNTAIFPPNVTTDQLTVVKTLIENGCLSDNLTIDITMEYQICQNQTSPAALEQIWQHKNILQKQIINFLQIEYDKE